MTSHFLILVPLPVCRSASPAWYEKEATWPFEAHGTGRSATQLVEAPGARRDIQPVQAPGASSDMKLQPTGTSSRDDSAMDRSLTSTRTVTDNTGVSHAEDEMASEPESPVTESDWEVLSDRDPVTEYMLDQEHTEEANYRETMRGARFSWACTRSLTLPTRFFQWMTTLLPVPKPSLPGKYPSSYRLMIGCAGNWRS